MEKAYASGILYQKPEKLMPFFDSADAVIDYTAAGGAKGSPAELAAWLDGVFNPSHYFRINRHQHLITNVEIKRGKGPDSKVVKAAFTAPMSLSIIPSFLE